MAKLKSTSITGSLNVSSTASIDGQLTVKGSLNATGGLNAGQLNTGAVPEERLTKATTSVYGITKLNNSIGSTSTSEAATAASVKAVNDNANTRLKLDGTTTMTGQLKVSGTNGINFGNDDTITYNDTDNRFEFKSDNATASKVKAGTFEGTLNGKADTAGTADQASKWTTARTITLGGDLTGNVSMNGTSNVTLNAEVKDNSHNHNSIASRGNVAAEAGTTAQSVTGLSMSQAYNNNFPKTFGNVLNLRGSGLSQLMMEWQGGTGTGSLLYRSKSDNSAAAWSSWKTIAFTDSNITGNSATATRLQNTRQINGSNFDGTANITTAKWGAARTITLGGDLTGSVNLDGSASVTLSGQVKDDSHNHTILNSQYGGATILRDQGNGNVTISGAKSPSGVVGDLYLGYNAGTTNFTKDVLLGRTMKWQSNGATIVDSNGQVPWGSISGKPSTFTPSSHNHNYLPSAGGSLTGDVTFSTDNTLQWSRNTDFASIHFKNTSDGDGDSYMSFRVGDNGNEYFKFTSNGPGGDTTLLDISRDFFRYKGHNILHTGNQPNSMPAAYISGGGQAPNYFGSNNLKLQMLQVGGDWGWCDTLWMSSYGGGDVKGSNQLVVSKYNSKIGFRRQNYDSGTWGGLNEIYHTGRKPSPGEIGAAAISGGAKIFCQSGSPSPTSVGDIWISW